MSTASVDVPLIPHKAKPRGKNSGELLLRIAAKLFREKGYTATSIRDIAKRAHIESSALYYYFASKEALLDAVLERSINSVMAAVREAIRQLPADASPRERFRVSIATHSRVVVLHGDYALASRRVIGQIPLSVRRKHDAMRGAYGGYWKELFNLAARNNDFADDAQPGLARMLLLGAINWTTEWFDANRKAPEEVAAIFCDILFGGLGPKPRQLKAVRAKQ
ncbi:MAG: TetR/AcrR family transcriptional regulator [Rhizobium sp.]